MRVFKCISFAALIWLISGEQHPGHGLSLDDSVVVTANDSKSVLASAPKFLLSTTALSKAQDDPSDDDDFDDDPDFGTRTPWHKAECRGKKLHQAMISDRDQAANHVSLLNSIWGGELVDELKTWGYSDITESDKEVDRNCDFEGFHKMTTAFSSLGISPLSSKNGGPSKCYKVVHRDGPVVDRNDNGTLPSKVDQKYTVNNKQYRVSTGGYASEHCAFGRLLNTFPGHRCSIHHRSKCPRRHYIPCPSRQSRNASQTSVKESATKSRATSPQR